MTEDDELAAVFRDGLQRRAQDVDASVDMLRPVTSAARRQRRRRFAVTGGVGLVAAALVAAVVVQNTGGASGPDGPKGPQVVDHGQSDSLSTGWRTEYWHDVQVDVPADWGWGTAPITMSFDARTPLLCGGPGAMVRPDGKRRANAANGTAWVGRPIMMSDDCLAPPYPPPTAPYLWFDAARATPGTVDLGNGFTQESVEVNGSMVTVATQDPELRQRILDSATGGETCSARLDQPPSVESMLTEGMGEVRSAQVCAYRLGDRDHYDLVYATTLEQSAAKAFAESTSSAPTQVDPEFCTIADEYVVITLTGDDPYGTEPVSQDAVLNTGCGDVEVTPGNIRVLTDEAKRPWSQNGIQVTLFSFIGMLG